MKCSQCGGGTALRVPRNRLDRFIGRVWKTARMRCGTCGWEWLSYGNLRPLGAGIASFALAGIITAAGLYAAFENYSAVVTTLPVFARYEDKGTALYPGQHSMGVELSSDDPRATLDRSLDIRSGCVWGKPGADPYTGSIENALATPGLPDEVVRSIADKIRRKKRSGVVQISNDGISTADGRYFGKTAATMTYGKTVCFNTRINFAQGHVEYADLYDTWDSQGKPYSVMVPYVCGNVSVLLEQPRAVEDQVHTVPEPGSMALFVSAILGMIAFRRR